METIRRARPDEAALISDLALRSKAHWGYAAAFIEACRDDLTLTRDEIAATPVFVLESDGRVLGFYQFGVDDGEAEIASLFVEPAAIGGGIGKRLWHHAATLARARGYRSLVVQSDPYAEGFYSAMGMERIGETPSTVFPGRMLPQMRIALTGDAQT
jgi:ribosomal protein S18 acetylase RimI-like enzyme